MKPSLTYPRPVPHKVIPLLRDPNYANFLRVIGQALEILDIAEFDLRILDSECVVSAHFLPGKLKALAKQQTWIIGAARYRTEASAKTVGIEFRFTPGEVARLAQDFGCRRGIPNRSSETFGVAELLRVVGHYLDLKKASLLGVFRRDPFLTLRYRADQGVPKHEYFQSSFFYGLFVKMYSKRRDRVSSSLVRPER